MRYSYIASICPTILLNGKRRIFKFNHFSAIRLNFYLPMMSFYSKIIQHLNIWNIRKFLKIFKMYPIQFSMIAPYLKPFIFTLQYLRKFKRFRSLLCIQRYNDSVQKNNLLKKYLYSYTFIFRNVFLVFFQQFLWKSVHNSTSVVNILFSSTLTSLLFYLTT